MKQSALSTQKYKYEYLIFALLIFQLITQMKLLGKLDNWFSTTFTLSYEFGLNSRMLAGSLLSLFTDYITNSQLMIFNLFFICLLMVYYVFLMSKVIKKYADTAEKELAMLYFVFACAPLSFGYVFQYAYLIDTFSILFFLLVLTLEDKKIFKWLIPIICFLGMANHQTFICFYVPAIGIILLYKCLIKKKKSPQIILFSCFCIVSIASFVYFQVFKHPLPFATVDEAFDYLSKKAEYPIVKEMIEIEYYLENIENLTIYGGKNVLVRIESQIVMLLFYSGFISFFTYVWTRAIKLSTQKMMKFTYFLCLVSPVVTLIAYVFATDWGRWNAQTFIAQTALLSYWLYHKRQEVVTPVFAVFDFFKQHKNLAFASFVVLCIVFFINHAAYGSVSDIFRNILPF